MLDLACGDSLDTVSERYKIPKSTVKGYADKVKERMGSSPAVLRENAFDEKVKETAVALMEAIRAHCEYVGDRTWFLNMTSKPGGVDDVIKLRKAIGTELIAIVSFTTGQQLPQQSAPAIEAEIVDA